MAARRVAHGAIEKRQNLRLVPGSRRRSRARSARAAGTFRAVCVCFVLMALAGTVRVALAARAAEASMDAWELSAQVKEERLVGRTLEADRSALAAPSRIEAVASQTLNMTRPTQVSYLQLSPPPASGGSQAVTGATPAGAPSDAESGLVATVMNLAASEAQVLLVGDVGLGSLR